MPLSDLKLDIISWFRWRRYRKEFPIFLELLKPQKDDVILDVGAGTGIIASKVCALCDEVFALEPAAERVEYIKRKFPEVKAFQGLSENIHFPDSYFTKVYVVNAFHHFGNQESAISEFGRILKPGGLVLVQDMNPEVSVAKMERRLSKPNFKTAEEMGKSLEAGNFTILRLEKTERGYFVLCQKS